MMLEEILRLKDFFIYSNKEMFLKGNSSSNFFCSKNKVTLSEPINFFDSYLKYSTLSSSVQTFLENVAVPYLNLSVKDRKTFDSRFFPESNANSAYFVSKNVCLELKYNSSKRSDLQIGERRFSITRKIPYSQIEKYFNNNELISNKKSYSSFQVIHEKRHSTLIDRIPPFIMTDHSNNNYYFENIAICVDVRNEAGRIIINSPREETTKNHPFVFSSGRICLNNEDFLEEKGISKSYKNLNQHFLSDLASYILTSRQILVQGYTKDVRPVKYLNTESFSAEHRRAKDVLR